MKIWNKLKLQQLHLIDSENKELACGDKTRLMIGGFSGGGVVADCGGGGTSVSFISDC